jgi:hypothetical protein
LPAVAVVLALFAVATSVNLQLPLYAAYGDRAGYGQGLRAVAFASYVVGLIPILALFGGLSDKLGRKLAVLLSLALAIAATALMLIVPTVMALMVARLFQGASVAVSAAACTAYLAELLPIERAATQAASLTALTTAVGFGFGALMTSLCRGLPGGMSLQPPSFWIELAFLAVAVAGVLAIPAGTGRTRRAEGAARLLRLPCFPAGTAVVTIASATAWTVSGVIVGLLSSALSQVGMAGWSGAALMFLTGAGAVVQLVPWLRPASVTVGLRIGACCTTIACILFALGVWQGQALLLCLAATLTGASGFGYTYVAGLIAVSEAAGEHRARAVSGFLMWSYIGFGLPSVVIGVMSDHVGLPAALAGLAVVVGITWVALLVPRAVGRQ